MTSVIRAQFPLGQVLLEPSSHFGKHVDQRVSRQSANAWANSQPKCRPRLHLYSLNLLSWSLTFSNLVAPKGAVFMLFSTETSRNSVSVVCRPTRWLTCLPMRRWDRILYLYRWRVNTRSWFTRMTFLLS